MITPTSMLPSPAMRNSRSSTCNSRARARFTPRGLMKGAMPSSTRNSPSAASRSVRLSGIADQPYGASAARRLRLARVSQVAEELAVRRQHQEIAVLAEGVLVGLQAAPERVELRVARVCLGVALRRGGIAITTGALRIALGVGENHGALPLGVRLDARALLLTFGAQLVGDPGEALLHALVDALRDLIGQIDALDAHVHQLHAQPAGIAARLAGHLGGDGGTLGGDDLLQGALRDHALDAVLDDLGQPLAGDLLAAAGGAVVGARILDTPLDVEIDDQVAPVVGEEGLAGVRLGE